MVLIASTSREAIGVPVFSCSIKGRGRDVGTCVRVVRIRRCLAALDGTSNKEDIGDIE
jgi:hypothetical protein